MTALVLVPCHAGIAEGFFAPRRPIPREARRLALMSWERFDRAYVPLDDASANVRRQELTRVLTAVGAPAELGDEVAAIFQDGCVALLDWRDLTLPVATRSLAAWREELGDELTVRG